LELGAEVPTKNVKHFRCSPASSRPIEVDRAGPPIGLYPRRWHVEWVMALFGVLPGSDRKNVDGFVDHLNAT
jgi:hypothetical protein